MNRNIRFTTDELPKYFSNYRCRWEDLYPSERYIIERVVKMTGGCGEVLDVGCAVGGLGLALQEKFKIEKYIGVDVNKLTIDAANSNKSRFRIPVGFINSDILEVNKLGDQLFDIVTSFGVIDWNIEVLQNMNACWKYVKPNGGFIFSMRLTPQEGINNFERSFQWVNYSGNAENAERANYAVINGYDALRIFQDLQPAPSHILGYGYWGKPTYLAVTPFKEVVHSVFSLRKSDASNEGQSKIESELIFPLDLWL